MGSRKGGPWKGSHSSLAGVSVLGLFFVRPLPSAEQVIKAASWLYADRGCVRRNRRGLVWCCPRGTSSRM